MVVQGSATIASPQDLKVWAQYLSMLKLTSALHSAYTILATKLQPAILVPKQDHLKYYTLTDNSGEVQES